MAVTSASSALIQGYSGVVMTGGGAANNFGTIAGTGDYGGWGVKPTSANEILINGAAGHAKATVEGYGGVQASASGFATVINFGTISDAGGTAVQFVAASDLLVVEAGCAFDGQVLGGGGTFAELRWNGRRLFQGRRNLPRSRRHRLQRRRRGDLFGQQERRGAHDHRRDPHRRPRGDDRPRSGQARRRPLAASPHRGDGRLGRGVAGPFIVQARFGAEAQILGRPRAAIV